MASVVVVRSINAPADTVFQTVADPNRFVKAIAGVTKLEFLSKTTSGVGTRFRQTRVMKGKPSTMDFDITEYVKNQRVRIVNETDGNVWDSVFTVEPDGNATKLTMRMETKSERLFVRLMMPLICMLIKKAVAGDMNAVKAMCERRGN